MMVLEILGLGTSRLKILSALFGGISYHDAAAAATADAEVNQSTLN
jgi:hypothetical protein